MARERLKEAPPVRLTRIGPIARATVVALLCLAAPAATAGRTKPFTTQVPEKAAVRDRHTLLLASFDSATSNDADYARHERRAATFETKRNVRGRFGRGVLLSGPPMDKAVRQACYVMYDGMSNFVPAQGTAQFWIKSNDGVNLWSDDRTYIILSLVVRSDRFYEKHRGRTLALKKTGKGAQSRLSLLCKTSRRRNPYDFVLSAPVSDLKPQAWHHVFLSWDLSHGGAYWLAVDGKGVKGTADSPLKGRWVKPGVRIVVGGMAELGDAADYVLDDLVITEQSVRSVAESAKRAANGADRIDTATLMRCEDAVRRFLDFLLRVEYKGTWITHYSWPTRWPAGPQPRSYYIGSMLLPPNMVHMSKGLGPADTARQFMRAYRIMGDWRYLDACRRTGDFLIAVQKWFDGGWRYNPVEIAPDGLRAGKGSAGDNEIGIQEGQQLTPAFLLAQLYHQTGEQRYLDAFRWSCDTVLAAQNPCGAWPGMYDVKARKGVRRHGYSWLDDAATYSGFIQMAAAYHVLQDRKYWDAAIRSSDWLVRAQIQTPVGWGWAQQYDEKDKACWGRGHEPPAVCTVPSRTACRQLGQTYDMTGDRKYLDAIRRYADFVDNCGHAERGSELYFDIKTGRPIVPWNGKVYFKEDILKAPPELVRFLKVSMGYSAVMSPKPPNTKRLRGKWLLPRKTGPYSYPLPRVEDILRSALAGLSGEGVRKALESQNPAGPWVGASGLGPVVSSLPRTLWWDLLPAVETARVALGELPRSAIRRWWRYWPDIHPSTDYQDTPALKARGWTREQKPKQVVPPMWILKGARGW